MAITPGAQAVTRFDVADSDTAIALGSGDVPVLATPRVIAWCEAVTVEAVAPLLASGETTVGYQVKVDHLSPTPVGASVEVAAEIVEVDGRQITFSVTVADQNGTAAAGTIVRVVVERQKFIDRLSS
jgi:predicted thioesterase